jgi:serine phosphatase RsbU (regulator of sigma subunit)/anti-sigma regulatory factor (Ser/Thr protein kinase)
MIYANKTKKNTKKRVQTCVYAKKFVTLRPIMKTKHLPVISALFLVIAMTIQFVVSYQWEKKRVLEHIDYEMELAQKDFIFEIYDIQDAGEEMCDYINRHLDDPEAILRHTYTMVRRFPDVMSCYVSFRPCYYNDSDYWYCPASWRVGDSIVTTLYGDKEHDYFQRKWYKGAVQSEKGLYWSQAYHDEDFNDPICTHSIRFEKDGDFVCVIGLDFSLLWVNKMLNDIKPFDDAYCKLMSSDGSMVLATDEMLQLHQTKRKVFKKNDWIISSVMLSPVDMRLEIGVPKHHLWESVWKKSLITLGVLLIGILVAGLLIRQIRRDQAAFARVETENKLMERELQIASRIQRGILRDEQRNKGQGTKDDVDVLADLVPMKEVGGDLYDYFRKGDDLFFIIGDVSGKGVPAAMFMSATVNLFRSAVRRLQSPKAIMEEINSVLSDNNPSMMFVTAFIGRLNGPTGEMLYCNAGHLSPIKVQRDKGQGTSVTSLTLVPNIPIGYEGKFKFEEQGTMLGEGDLIVLYTDGITESRNERRDMLGMKRWMEIVAHCSAENEQKPVNQMLLEQVKNFMGKAEQVDDVTLMVIRKNSEQIPVSIRVNNRPDQWPVLRNELHYYGLCAGLDKRSLKKLEVALEEAVVNIVNYSQATEIELKIKNEELKIILILSDNGVAFDPTAQEEKDINKAIEERQIGGLGIALVKQIADEVNYRRIDETNELTIIKNI